MSLPEIEAELDKLTSHELRQLAVKSWRVFVEKEGLPGSVNECDEDDPALLSALDEALARADATPVQGYSAPEVRVKIAEWTSR